MNKIKQKVIKAYPTIYKLYKEVSEECAKNGCRNCCFYNDAENTKGLCIYCSLSDVHNAISVIIQEENLKENSNA